MMGYAFPAPLGGAGADYNTFFLAGVLTMAGSGIATNTAWGFFTDRDNGIFYEMLTYPLSRAEFLLGKVAFNLGLAVVQAALTLSLGVLVLGIRVPPQRWPLLFLGVVAGTAGWFFFFAILALKIRRNDVFNTILNVLYFVLLFVSPVFYPLEPLPAWFRAAARANPLTWHVDLLRYASIGVGEPGIVLAEAAAFVIFSLLSFGYAVRCLQHRD